MIRFDVLTLHPEMVDGPLSSSVLGRAVKRGCFSLGVHDIRDHTTDRHRSADDAPYGGGAGMVLKADVVGRAIDEVRREGSHVILTSPSGRPFSQADAHRLAAEDHLVIVCGHYEGVDARIEAFVDEEISLGDFVLTGGEIAAVAVVDAVARLLPGVLGNSASPEEESFSEGLLEYPHFTRPRVWRDQEVPEVLLSGHHGQIAAWRLSQAKQRTRQRRPDLWRRWLAQQGKGVDEHGSDE
jgi:tRNA (guanine37-N1)-methyltransferase